MVRPWVTESNAVRSNLIHMATNGVLLGLHEHLRSITYDNYDYRQYQLDGNLFKSVDLDFRMLEIIFCQPIELIGYY